MVVALSVILSTIYTPFELDALNNISISSTDSSPQVKLLSIISLALLTIPILYPSLDRYSNFPPTKTGSVNGANPETWLLLYFHLYENLGKIYSKRTASSISKTFHCNTSGNRGIVEVIACILHCKVLPISKLPLPSNGPTINSVMPYFVTSLVALVVSASRVIKSKFL